MNPQPDLYLSGKANGGQTQILHVSGRSVEQTAQLAELLGFEEKTVLIALWLPDFNDRPTSEITPSVRVVLWPGRQAA